MVGIISCEVDADARRLMRRRWPGLIEWGDVRSISREHVLKASSVYGQICDMVILGAGSPCQDLSSLKGVVESVVFPEPPELYP